MPIIPTPGTSVSFGRICLLFIAFSTGCTSIDRVPNDRSSKPIEYTKEILKESPLVVEHKIDFYTQKTLEHLDPKLLSSIKQLRIERDIKWDTAPEERRWIASIPNDLILLRRQSADKEKIKDVRITNDICLITINEFVKNDGKVWVDQTRELTLNWKLIDGAWLLTEVHIKTLNNNDQTPFDVTAYLTNIRQRFNLYVSRSNQ